MEEAIEGLRAHNDGPSVLGTPTGFTATHEKGTSVLYEWEYGDGQTGTGAAVDHTYAASGTFLAKVTATNSLGSEEATTQVIVVPASGNGTEAIGRLIADNNGPTNLGSPTVSDGNHRQRLERALCVGLW